MLQICNQLIFNHLLFNTKFVSMNKHGGKIDMTDKEKANEKLAKLKEKTANKHLRESIGEKQRYINKPVCK